MQQKERVLETEIEVHELLEGDIKDTVQWLAATRKKLSEPHVIKLDGSEIEHHLTDNEVEFSK